MMHQQFESTLDEPITVTVMRDIKGIKAKLEYVLLHPSKSRTDSAAGLREWDLWGPLLLCLALAVSLWIKADNEQKRLVFSLVFAFVWLGAAIVTMNAQLLRSKISFFQSLCVLGYCLAPLVLAAFLCDLLPHVLLAIIKLPLLALAVWWSCGASIGFISAAGVPEDRKLLAVYPVLLFYIFVGCMIIFT